MLLYKNILIISLWHLAAFYGIYMIMMGLVNMSEIFIYLGVFYFFSNIGVTAGLHRLWSHRSYTASYPLRLFLAILASLANQKVFMIGFEIIEFITKEVIQMPILII